MHEKFILLFMITINKSETAWKTSRAYGKCEKALFSPRALSRYIFVFCTIFMPENHSPYFLDSKIYFFLCILILHKNSIVTIVLKIGVYRVSVYQNWITGGNAREIVYEVGILNLIFIGFLVLNWGFCGIFDWGRLKNEMEWNFRGKLNSFWAYFRLYLD